MLEVFMTLRVSTICHDFIHESSAVNKNRYKEDITHLWEEFNLHSSKMWVARVWVLLHVNA